MQSKLKRVLLGSAILLTTLLVSVGCSKSTSAESNKVVVGSIGSDVTVWQHIAKSPQAKKAGLEISVKPFSDGVSLNKATLEGSVDANAFQSYAYYDTFNKQSDQGKLKSVGSTYLEPMGIYSKNIKNLKDIKSGATVAIPDNTANETRALLLLEAVKLITLKDGFNSFSSLKDIKSNPLNLKFKEIDDTTGPRVMESVDLVVINNTIAFEGGLNVVKDSLYHEEVSQKTKININLIAIGAKKGDEKLGKKLVKLYHNKEIQAWISKKFDGTKVEIND